MRLEEAIRKMTSQAVSRVGITDRGLLRPGMMAAKECGSAGDGNPLWLRRAVPNER